MAGAVLREVSRVQAIRLAAVVAAFVVVGVVVSSSRAGAPPPRQLAAAERALVSWPAAVWYVGRFFGPERRRWLWSCSLPRSEGGHGRWVPNSHGSGAGGWLQFMPGTFFGVIDAAIGEGRRRGMRVPVSARSWYSPLGQALAGMEMLAQGRRGEWQGYGC